MTALLFFKIANIANVMCHKLSPSEQEVGSTMHVYFNDVSVTVVDAK